MKKQNALNKKVALSRELASFIGSPEASRPEVVSAMWDYIKTNNLQNPANKREILPDSKLGLVLGADPVHMMKLMSVLGKHFVGAKGASLIGD